MPVLCAAGTLAAIGAYSQSKEKMWLWGAALFFSVVPYTLLVMKKTNSQLNNILKESGEAEELEESDKATVKDKMSKWVKMHRGRVLIALSSAAVFFVAKQYTKA